MTVEVRRRKHKALKITRFLTLLLESTSFLHSHFDNPEDSTNLTAIWQGFDHPFEKETNADE
jgi:hypothetical protein